MMRESFGRIVLAIVTAAACCWSVTRVSDRVVAAELSSLSGHVYVDQDVNGIWDPKVEWVLPGVELVLDSDQSGWTPLTAVTDDTGFYEFTALDAATYRIIQEAIPGGYLNIYPGVGTLWDGATGLPSSAFPGTAVNYDQANGIPAQVADIELPAAPTQGLGYDFGQIWTGKGWYLTTPGWTLPPGGIPPTGVPEPSAVALLAIGATLLAGWRLGVTRRNEPT